VLPITIFAYCISVPVLSRCGVSICDEKCAGILVRTVLLHHVLKLVCGDGAWRRAVLVSELRCCARVTAYCVSSCYPIRLDPIVPPVADWRALNGWCFLSPCHTFTPLHSGVLSERTWKSLFANNKRICRHAWKRCNASRLLIVLLLLCK